jgi:phosphoesterase RecJ-like protein
MLDTADIRHIGPMRDPVCRAKEVFIIDHHEVMTTSSFSGISDPAAASTCELAVELAAAMGTVLDLQTASAAYAGIVYDTGFFAYQKTGIRTFNAVHSLLQLGVSPNETYINLRENSSVNALLLQKKAFSSLGLHCNGKVCSQVLHIEDFTETGAVSDDTDGFVNVPLKSRDIIVSVFIKESVPNKVRCSLRSKGTVDVSGIARELGGGGHLNAAGFKSKLSVDQTLSLVLAKINGYLSSQ